MKKIIRSLVALVVIAGLTWGGWKVYQLAQAAGKPQESASPGTSIPEGRKAVPVTVVAAGTRDVPVQFATFGTVEAYASVGVKAQVTGMLMKVHFQKGQDIRKGDLLFEIDPRPFDAAVKQAEATVTQAEAAVARARAAVAQAEGARARDQAQEANAQRILVRQSDMLKKGVAAQAEYDKALADADALAAAVRADEAAVQAGEADVRAQEAAVHVGEAALVNAKLQLEDCTIYSPISGKAGNLLVTEGSIVTEGLDVSLVVINQISPIDVFFSIPQKDLPAVKKYMAQGKLRVNVLLPEEKGGEEAGELTFVDNAMDRMSGTMRLGATFENKDERLLPGQYVNVLLVLAVQKDALVVPAKAVQAGREGKYVYVVRKEEHGARVEMVSVTTGAICGDDVVILEAQKFGDREGLKVGDQVVTDGQFQLKKDSTVEIKGEGSKDKGAVEKEAPGEGGEKKASGKRAAS